MPSLPHIMHVPLSAFLLVPGARTHCLTLIARRRAGSATEERLYLPRQRSYAAAARKTTTEARPRNAQEHLCSTPSQRSPGHVRFAGLPRLRRLNRNSVPLLRSSTRATSGSLDCQDSEGSTAPLFQSIAAQSAHVAQRLQELNSNSIPHVLSAALPSRLKA